MAHRIRIGLVGFGAIARRQHLPTIRTSRRFDLVAVADPSGAAIEGGRVYADLRRLLDTEPVDAVAICTPPVIRAGLARMALAAGKHVLLEKPPTATLAEAQALIAAKGPKQTLFAAWHSHFNPAVARAKTLLAGRRLARVEVIWTEPVGDFHAGQDWIWQPGGFGVFDMGINPISILTRILPERLDIRSATLVPRPGGHTPVAVTLRGSTDVSQAEVTLRFDWRVETVERVIEITCDDGAIFAVLGGGRILTFDGQILVDEPKNEYARIYDRFADLIARGEADADLEPLRLASDALRMHDAAQRTGMRPTHVR